MEILKDYDLENCGSFGISLRKFCLENDRLLLAELTIRPIFLFQILEEQLKDVKCDVYKQHIVSIWEWGTLIYEKIVCAYWKWVEARTIERSSSRTLFASPKNC
ncbi:hypothetical protein EPI10_011583 [Gossypium australe]|uniref:Uncharacterized protein n=1 Tax=Gossypium australe TaxID=47621 RepID=A0A5B6W927_9ROSI|nr:hypothetical protein EPI10_011583 [Gossypium australe]